MRYHHGSVALTASLLLLPLPDLTLPLPEKEEQKIYREDQLSSRKM